MKTLVQLGIIAAAISVATFVPSGGLFVTAAFIANKVVKPQPKYRVIRKGSPQYRRLTGGRV